MEYIKKDSMTDDELMASSPNSGQASSTMNDVSSVNSPNALVGSKCSKENIAIQTEAYVHQRILDLQKEGQWEDKMLRKGPEIPRVKTHWDYLLEEMTWLSTTIAKERKLKVLAGKKCSRMIEKYFQDRGTSKQRAENEEFHRKLRECANLAKEVRNFWTNARKLVELSEKSKIEQLKKDALDDHLNIIVKQTEEYSNMLAETLTNEDKTVRNTQADTTHYSGSYTRISRCNRDKSDSHDDDDFTPLESEEDDEETISKADEEDAKNKSAVRREIALLKEESEIPMDDFLDQLPEGYLNWRVEAGDDFDGTPEVITKNSSTSKNVDTEESTNTESSDGGSDSENTTGNKSKNSKYNERAERSKRSSQVFPPSKGSKERDNISIKNGANATKFKTRKNLSAKFQEMKSGKAEKAFTDNQVSSSGSESAFDSQTDEVVSSDSDAYMTEDDDTDVDEDPEQTHGLANLLESFAPNRVGEDHIEKTNLIAAEAESFQPKGFTLSSTKVTTKIPFLLKHTLREYQHIGLDWLVAMYTKKLNGILADEMGLGKTIQTIALLAHLACEKGNWGPHLIVVPTSVMLNWEMEIKKWCPGFKILTYFGSQKERKIKRIGWTKPNNFHICITSYKLVIQDYQSFRRQKWKYLILDEAQNIKNFKSQRWQLLLNFQSQRRLLLTGTPLQNNLMELWSLMHFLMPNVFQSHREFREWFSDPVSDMVEGDSTYDNNVIQRLHKVLRPFILRRLKSEVEKQLPRKYNHVILCRLSKRQRYLYDEYMELASTKETLVEGNLFSVINVLMQLRKVCNHPNLFEHRPIVSPFEVERITVSSPSLAWNILDENKINFPSFSLFSMTEADFKFSKNDGLEIWSRQHTFNEELNDVEEMEISQIFSPVHPSIVKESRDCEDSRPINHGRFSEPPSLPEPDSAITWYYRPSDDDLIDDEAECRIEDFARQTPPPNIIDECIERALSPKSPNAESLYAFESSEAETWKSVDVKSDMENMDDGDSQSPEISELSDSQESSPPSFMELVTQHKPEDLNATPEELNMAKMRFNLMLALKDHEEWVSRNTGTVKYLPLTKLNSLWLQSVGYSDVNPFLPCEIEERILLNRMDILLKLKRINEERCKLMPIIGADTVSICKILTDHPSARYCKRGRQRLNRTLNNRDYSTEGYYRFGHFETLMAFHSKLCGPDSLTPNFAELKWRMTNGLMNLTWTLEERLQMLSEVIKNFVMFVPAVSVQNPYFNYFRPSYAYYSKYKRLEQNLECQLRRSVEIVHPIVTRMATQFPDPRLIEYDCGKLQVLNRLLKALKAEDHRVLLFTQMTKMLDVLESFLNCHGHIYLRMDGSTKIEQRQLLMERFNTDKKIFCFILTTRSGGIGVNLTGADTVVFYDSDWNPTMDAQAQDRCHRIGQTRDVNIYRLISERTIEENIFKKSNQKRILGELTIEGGNFTPSFFKMDSIHSLFNVDSSGFDPLQRIKNDLKNSTSVMNSSCFYTQPAQKENGESSQVENNSDTTHLFESVLAEAEDETDVMAARTLQAEVAAELEEFDENIPFENSKNAKQEETLKPDMEMTIITTEMVPIDRYAIRFMHHYIEDWAKETLSSAKKGIEQQKLEWQLEQSAKEAVQEVMCNDEASSKAKNSGQSADVLRECSKKPVKIENKKENSLDVPKGNEIPTSARKSAEPTVIAIPVAEKLISSVKRKRVSVDVKNEPTPKKHCSALVKENGQARYLLRRSAETNQVEKPLQPKKVINNGQAVKKSQSLATIETPTKVKKENSEKPNSKKKLNPTPTRMNKPALAKLTQESEAFVGSPTRLSSENVGIQTRSGLSKRDNDRVLTVKLKIPVIKIESVKETTPEDKSENTVVEPIKRKRGRPRKYPLVVTTTETD